MNRTINTLFMLMSLDGKISNGPTDNLDVDRHLNSFPIFARHKDGIVTNFGDLECNLKKDITLDELLVILEKTKKDKLDYSEIQDSVSNHQVDLKLRKRILQLVALKLLYSKKTIPERGYERARRFIGEFNKSIPGLGLTIQEIEELMNDYFDNKTKNDKIIMEEVTKKKNDKIKVKKRQIIKKIFNKR